jgi:predicted NAD/FAD-dependent oxidoreductase
MTDKTIGVVGSGISGLMCGQLLKEAGHSVFLVDKGRRSGGRMSTRNKESWQWDHGAQYFTVRDDRFAPYVDAWKKHGVVSEWFTAFPGQASGKKEARYIGVNGMNTIPRNLSSDLNIHQSMCVDTIAYDESIWQLVMKSGEVFTCEELVLTPPLPQVVHLLKESNLFNQLTDSSELASVEYEKGLSLMLVLKEPSLIPSPGCLKLDNGLVSWIADNSQKEGFPNQYCVTVHANPKYADDTWNEENNGVAKAMIQSIEPLLGSSIVDWHIHRWLYAFAKNPLKSSFYRDASMHLTIAGDAFVASRVESAALSGISAAETLIASLK